MGKGEMVLQRQDSVPYYLLLVGNKYLLISNENYTSENSWLQNSGEKRIYENLEASTRQSALHDSKEKVHR